MSIEILASAGAWLWDKYGKDISDNALEGIKTRWMSFKWQNAANSYRERVRNLHSTSRILGNPKPIILNDIYTDVFVIDKLTAFRRFDIEQLKEMTIKEDKDRKLALRLAVETDRLLVLGKPGAGKTTFLKHVILLSTGGKIGKIPIYVSVKAWGDSGLELMSFIVKQFEVCAFPDAKMFIEHILNKGEAIVMFDGLDEISQENGHRAHVTRTIIDFSDQYQSSKCFITCRIAATDYAFNHFTYVEVADFNDKQIYAFALKWFKENEAKKRAFLNELYLPENEGLREFARTPLLLTLLCLSFDETMTFPQRRVDVYEEALDTLLRKWDASHDIKRDSIYRNLSLSRKRQLFSRVAAEYFERGEYFFKQSDLEKKMVSYLHTLPIADKDVEIDGTVLLKSIESQHGVFVERAQHLYSFSHSTFQEYFTSHYIVDNAANGTISGLIDNHLTDSRWREVFLLTASLLDNADSFFLLFREAVDKIISNDKKLIEIIKWANEKTLKDYNNLFPRPFACAVALDIDLYRERARTNADALSRANTTIATGDLIVALNRATNPTQDLSRTASAAFVRHKDQEKTEERYARALAVSNTSSLSVALARDLAFSCKIDVTNKISFQNPTDPIISSINFSLNACDQLNLIHLKGYLEKLAGIIPTEKDNIETWSNFSKALRGAMLQDRNIGHEWNLENKQIDKLHQYNKVNALLMDCLRLASVTNRGEIEETLLLPPSDNNIPSF